MKNKAIPEEQIEEMIAKDNEAFYQDILDNPAPEKLAMVVINLLEYMQGSTQAYLTNQATCLSIIDVLQRKNIFTNEEFYESLKHHTEEVSKGFQDAMKEQIEKTLNEEEE